MSDETRRSRIVDALRSVTLGVERAVAEEAATGAVLGASEGLRRELDGAASDAREWLERAATEAARAALASMRAPDGVAAAAAHTVAASATRGALDELQRQWAEGGLPMHGIAERIDALLEDAHRAAGARERLSGIDDRAHDIAADVVRGAVFELRAALRDGAAVAAASSAARDVGYAVGRALADGFAAGAREHLGALSATAAAGVVDGVATSARRHAPTVEKAWSRAVATGAGAATDGTLSAVRRWIARTPAAVGAVVVLLMVARRR